jgi:hypothetical protein
MEKMWTHRPEKYTGFFVIIPVVLNTHEGDRIIRKCRHHTSATPGSKISQGMLSTLAFFRPLGYPARACVCNVPGPVLAASVLLSMSTAYIADKYLNGYPHVGLKYFSGNEKLGFLRD